MPAPQPFVRYTPNYPAGVLVVLPGVNSGAYLFEASAQIWARQWDVIVFNPPGVAGNPLPMPFTARAYAHWVLGMLDELGVQQFALLGHSLGSFAAQHVADLAPNCVDRLILVSSGIGQPQTTRDMAGMMTALGKSFWGVMEDIQRNPLHGMRVFFGSWAMHNPSAYAAFMEERKKWLPNAAATLAQLNAGAMFTSASWARGLYVPTLCIHGAADALVSPTNGQMLAEKLPQANWLLYHDVGHFPMLEHPSFAQHVEAFLEGQATGEMLMPLRKRGAWDKIKSFLFSHG